MIQTGFPFIATMFALCGSILWLEARYQHPVFKWVPSAVLIMFLSMLLFSLGLWQMTPEVKATRAGFRDNLIPAMLFLMALKFDLRLLWRLGPRLIILMLGATLSVAIGFILVHKLMHPFIGAETQKTFAVMAAGWTGGTENFVAIKQALDVSDSAMAYTLLMGAFCYTAWLTLLIALKPQSERFNRYLKPSHTGLDETLRSLDVVNQHEKDNPPTFQQLAFMLGLALLISVLTLLLGKHLALTLKTHFPVLNVINQSIIAIFAASITGLLMAPTPLAKIAGARELSYIMLFLIIALIGAEVNLSALSKAPIYVLSGFLILSIHAFLLMGLARILRVDFQLAVLASIANIGSSPSAVAVAGVYNPKLIPIGVVMGLMGSLLGSVVGLLVAVVLGGLSNG